MVRIGMIQFAHLGSVRIPNKVLAELRPGLTLLDLGLRKMKVIGQRYNVTPLLAVSETETSLIQKAKEQGVEVLLRDSKSVNSERWGDTVAGIKERLDSKFDQLLDVNIICRPFLKTETIGILCEAALKNRPFTQITVEQNSGIIWNEDDEIVIGKGILPNTKTNTAYSNLAHVGQVYPISKFYLSEEQLTAQMEPVPLTLRGIEKLDTDYPEDLELAQRIWSLYEALYI